MTKCHATPYALRTTVSSSFSYWPQMIPNRHSTWSSQATWPSSFYTVFCSSVPETVAVPEILGSRWRTVATYSPKRHSQAAPIFSPVCCCCETALVLLRVTSTMAEPLQKSTAFHRPNQDAPIAGDLSTKTCCEFCNRPAAYRTGDTALSRRQLCPYIPTHQTSWDALSTSFAQDSTTVSLTVSVTGLDHLHHIRVCEKRC